MNRPTCTPALMAEILDQAPKRLHKRLDKNPTIADSWDWRHEGDDWIIEVEEGVTVRLHAPGGILRSHDAISCTCLLAPRCLHVLACVSSLELSDGASEPTDDERPTGDPPPVESTVLADQQQGVVALAWSTLVELLLTGCRQVAPISRSNLLRAIHGCRVHALHRLAVALERLLDAIRAGADAPPALLALIQEALHTAHLLRSRELADLTTIGTGRRAYQDIGHLRLHALGVEAINHRRGYSGVVVHFCDADMRPYTASHILPSDMQDVTSAWKRAIPIGDISAGVHELARAGLHMQHARSSADHRLGGGKTVQAVLAPATAWSDEFFTDAFARPFADQLACWHPQQTRGPLYVAGTVTGYRGQQLLITLPDDRLLALQARDDTSRQNLATLATYQGLAIKTIVLADRSDAGIGTPIAIGPADDGWVIDDNTGGRIIPGFEDIRRQHLQHPRQAVAAIDWQPIHLPPGLQDVQGILATSVIAGRQAIPERASRQGRQTVSLLTRHGCPAGAGLTTTLLTAAHGQTTKLDGTRQLSDVNAYAIAWLTLAEWATAFISHQADGYWLHTVHNAPEQP